MKTNKLKSRNPKPETFAAEFTRWLGDRSEAAAAAALGIGRSTVSAYRRGSRKPGELALAELRARMKLSSEVKSLNA
jgi:predicted transcriptional regulator